MDEFSARVGNSGLLTAAELAECIGGLPEKKRPNTAEELAHALVQGNRLTLYQAKTLYQHEKQHLVLGNYVILDKLGQGAWEWSSRPGIGGCSGWWRSRF